MKKSLWETLRSRTLPSFFHRGGRKAGWKPTKGQRQQGLLEEDNYSGDPYPITQKHSEKREWVYEKRKLTINLLTSQKKRKIAAQLKVSSIPSTEEKRRGRR